MSDKIKVVLNRFLRAWGASTLATLAGLTWSNPSNWTDLKVALAMIGLSIVNGVIAGFFMAIDKFIRYVPEQQ